MLKSIVNRIAAGVVTPILSMLFYMAGWALYQHDPPWPRLSMLFVAAVFGAPLSVPVALLIPLRNVWRCLPLIALAAAIGYELQSWSITVPWSITVLVIPALFGAMVALLLRWRERLSIAAVPLGAVLVAALWFAGNGNAQAVAPAHAEARAWSVLHVGMLAYTGGYEKGQTICPSLSAYLDFERDPLRLCRSVANATPVIVDAIIPCKRSDPDWGWESPHVQVHARNGSWSGFTEASELQPDVQPGTLLDMERDWGAPLDIVNDRGTSTVIGGSARARLVRYDPKRNYSLYVEIIDGDHRGLRGWMPIQAVDTGDIALGQYSLQYPYQSCHNT